MANLVLSAKTGRAAMYVRMSTEHQQYSIENQADVIKKYAARRNLVIIEKFVDHGKSGVSLSGRMALRELLARVESGDAQFETILVYDVSRWGRFQDTDESAYYDYLCKRAGVSVHYCAEQFENDGSISSALLKTIKRSMAGEYSRELSVKVFAGQSRLVELGYWQGGFAGFGLRRQAVGRDGRIRGVLEIGEHKGVLTDRVILIPGPEKEVSAVRDIFDLFTRNRWPEREIAKTLNERGILTNLGRPWTRAIIQKLLINPKYAGANVYNRSSTKLKQSKICNPVDRWIRQDAAFEPLVPLAQFVQAQQIFQARRYRGSDAELLSMLRQLWSQKGKLSGALINGNDEMPSSNTFERRFKGLTGAYRLIGYEPGRNYSYQEMNERLKTQFHNTLGKIMTLLRSIGATVEHNGQNGNLLVNGQFTTSLVVSPCRSTVAGSYRWLFILGAAQLADVTVGVRLQPGNQEVLDYFLFPKSERLPSRLLLGAENVCGLDVYRFDTLDFFISLGRRRCLLEQI